MLPEIDPILYPAVYGMKDTINLNLFHIRSGRTLYEKFRDMQKRYLEAHEKFSLHWATAEEIFRNWEERNEYQDYSHWIYFLTIATTRAVALGYDTKTVLK